MVRVGCDIGGTFTDFVVLDEVTGEIFIEKDLTTPADPSEGLLEGLRTLEGAAPGYTARTRRIAHATTLVANTVIEKKGARTALLTTRGFRDVLELRNEQRYDIYDFFLQLPEPLGKLANTSVGLLVSGVDSRSGAAAAGVLLGDVIVAWNGEPVRDYRQVQRLLGPESVGSAVALTAVRAGALMELRLTVGERPSSE